MNKVWFDEAVYWRSCHARAIMTINWGGFPPQFAICRLYAVHSAYIATHRNCKRLPMSTKIWNTECIHFFLLPMP